MVPNGEALANRVAVGNLALRRKTTPRFYSLAGCFATLRDIRPWNANDRLIDEERDMLLAEISALPDDATVRLEVELVFRQSENLAEEAENVLRRAIVTSGGRSVSRCRISEISYHAMLVELPAGEVRNITARSLETIAGLEPVMHIRPQSIATTINVANSIAGDPLPPVAPMEQSPILAILDGVPVASTPRRLYNNRRPIWPRTSDTGLGAGPWYGDGFVDIARGSQSERPIGRRIHFVPVLGPNDRFPNDQLIVDLVYQRSSRCGRAINRRRRT